MEVTLPNLQSLEERVNQLVGELKRLREKVRTQEITSESLSLRKSKMIEKKVRHLIELIEEFSGTIPSKS